MKRLSLQWLYSLVFLIFPMLASCALTLDHLLGVGFWLSLLIIAEALTVSCFFFRLSRMG